MSSHIIRINKISLFDFSLIILILSMFLNSNANLRAVIELFFFSVAMIYYAKGVRPQNKKYILWNIAFLLYCGISYFYVEHKLTVLYGVRGVLEVSLIGIGIYIYMSNQDFNEAIFKIINYLKIASVLLVVYICSTVSLSNIIYNRMSGSTFNGNDMAVKWAFTSILLYYSIKEKRKKLNFYNCLFFAVMLCMIIFTGSKKGLLILLIGIAIVFLNYSPKKDRWFSFVVVALVISVVFYFIFNNAQLYSIIGWRIEALFNPAMDNDSSTRIRREMMEFGLDMFQKKKLVGYGINTFQDYSIFGTYAHNNYVELLFDTGIVGTAIYYSIHISIILKLFFKRERLCSRVKFFALMFCVILLCDYGMVSYGNEFMGMLLAVFCYGFYSR